MIEKVLERIYNAETLDELHQSVERFLAYYVELNNHKELTISEMAMLAQNMGYLSQAKILRDADQRELLLNGQQKYVA